MQQSNVTMESRKFDFLAPTSENHEHHQDILPSFITTLMLAAPGEVVCLVGCKV